MMDYSRLAQRFPWWPGPWRFTLWLAKVWCRLRQRGRGNFHFSNDWAVVHFEKWQRLLAPFRGQPGLSYLEVGCFEGRSLTWMFQNILTGKRTRAIAVDVFGPNYAWEFIKNLVQAGVAGQVKLRPGYSRDVLRRLKKRSFEIIYLDGSHSMADVFIDLSLSWDLLKPGGVMIIDDYLIGDEVIPKDLRPKLAIDTFLLAFGAYIEVLEHGLQVIFRKRSEVKTGDIQFAFGNAKYDWYRKTLSVDDGPRQPLRDAELQIFDKHIQHIEYSYRAPSVERALPCELVDVLRNRGARL